MQPSNRLRRWAALALLALFLAAFPPAAPAADAPTAEPADDGTTWIGASGACGSAPTALHTMGGSLSDELRAQATRTRGGNSGAAPRTGLGSVWPAVLLAALLLLLVM